MQVRNYVPQKAVDWKRLTEILFGIAVAFALFVSSTLGTVLEGFVSVA
jgi:hypothetical protein